MVGHQYIRMYMAGACQRELAQVLQITNAVDIAKETRLSVVAALYDVAGEINSGLSGHVSLAACVQMKLKCSTSSHDPLNQRAWVGI